MSFIAYDLLFLAVFCLVVGIFLYKRKANLKRQGILFLYPTKVGINFIESTTKKYRKLLSFLQYPIIACGYILMVTILWLMIRLAYSYLTSPTLATQLKVPVITPLIPYLPELFNLDFLPPFYFTYWIIIIAVIAIPHEFAHGIFARLGKIKVHSTGFGFLGPFLAAFVEPDEKKMAKAPKKSQLSVLAAGTFANMVMAVLFAVILWFFFFIAFSPSGIYFNSYAATSVDISKIDSISGIPLSDAQTIQIPNSTYLELQSLNKTYYTTKSALFSSLSNNLSYVYAYLDAPAFKSNLSGVLTKADNQILKSDSQLKVILLSKSPGDYIKIETKDKGVVKDYNLVLGDNNGTAYLGIGRAVPKSSGLLSSLIKPFYSVIDPLKYQLYYNGVNYESKIGELGMFIYDLLWWIILINVSVALMNMLPLGIFDGGRFFMITVAGITGSEKVGEIAYKISTYALLLLVAAFMVKWVFAII